jgi:LmbE family N-acetylglucosaminyl deacetylase
VPVTRDQPVVVLSPHLDDAVFSCGQLLAAHRGSTVITALAGVPAVDAALGTWDEEVGFASSHEAVLARRSEDTAACSVVSANPVWLDGLDGGQGYDLPPDHDDALAAQIVAALRGHHELPVFVPLGVKHDDHVKVARIGRWTATELGLEVRCYRDLPYGVSNPDALAAAMEVLEVEGWLLEPSSEKTGSRRKKEAALRCYASQFSHFGRAHLLAKEQYFRLRRTR